MRYNDAMGGVVLSVSGLSFEDGAKEGRIMDEMPHVHFDVKGKALVFRPKPGQILESRVNKVRWLWPRPIGLSNVRNFVQSLQLWLSLVVLLSPRYEILLYAAAIKLPPQPLVALNVNFSLSLVSVLCVFCV